MAKDLVWNPKINSDLEWEVCWRPRDRLWKMGQPRFSDESRFVIEVPFEHPKHGACILRASPADYRSYAADLFHRALDGEFGKVAAEHKEAAAKSSGKPAAAKSSGKPAAAKSSGKQAAAELSKTAATSKPKAPARGSNGLSKA